MPVHTIGRRHHKTLQLQCPLTLTHSPPGIKECNPVKTQLLIQTKAIDAFLGDTRFPCFPEINRFVSLFSKNLRDSLTDQEILFTHKNIGVCTIG